MTGLSGIAWLLFTMISGKPVVFQSKSIRFQFPLTICVIFMKYMILIYNRFQTRRALFKMNVTAYVCYLIAVLLIEYKDLWT